jgi:hypothetical protein
VTITRLTRGNPTMAAKFADLRDQAPKDDDGAIRAHYPRLPHTPLRDGVRTTIARFRELHAQGALDARDVKP